MSESVSLTEYDRHLFNEGSHREIYRRLGAHPAEEGTSFAVWAPAADRVSVIGDFNGWNRASHPLEPQGESGIWAGRIEGVGKGAIYKYFVRNANGHGVEKADPVGFHHETPPRTGSVVWDLDYEWGDGEWMAARARRNATDAPISIYEVHLGSWMRPPGREFHSYRELAPMLAEYVAELGFTHVELLPVMEHPFYGSWGYQTTGYFAPTSRYGTPQDFMYLIDTLHQAGIGVILDWVPSHFPTDEHGLAYFDGTHLYEHADPRKGYHPDWKSSIFNYGRNEVRSFLISSALFWLDLYHADGIRVDAVASMLYLDYSREEGEWIPNEHGGRENLEAIDFLRRLNEAIYETFPDTQTFAEESTAWPMVSRPTYIGGLGFGFKWDMGWMHDTLQYMRRDPVHRTYHHDEITFRAVYMFTENYTLPLSHDEVVYGKGSLLGKMPGDDWQQRANLRLLLGYMYGQPGKKLLFMGGEFGQEKEWAHEEELQWGLLERPDHAALGRYTAALNRVYRQRPALHAKDVVPEGFEWVIGDDRQNSVLAFLRRGRTTDDVVLCVYNFTPAPRDDYRVGVPRGGDWEVVLDSDADEFGGSGYAAERRTVAAEDVEAHGRSHSLSLSLPPLGALWLAPVGAG
ncbi:MAG: 1,4-alpha-glucan branching protein GlgB [Gemmatimonadetes bacterium]|nr:1,4-alpha-glucan branching protein GlgB [Gemmatimonadota bacterium]NIP83045.1 1,4-alpha-glucan branching protein GlgB [Gemmatimonadota bacterium]NIQ59069.1 1,4-alpha-glucan branching protein GlgB [Gemmatimonadota bacterium]NIW36546.1 1,4-alpha-glucan branching protein GlgB [Gemmatimonadota bacterium]NIX47958.1 1,4-alpha-glucan branching protein GlgB [Gemmatimonadota bacterium]